MLVWVIHEGMDYEFDNAIDVVAAPAEQVERELWALARERFPNNWMLFCKKVQQPGKHIELSVPDSNGRSKFTTTYWYAEQFEVRQLDEKEVA